MFNLSSADGVPQQTIRPRRYEIWVIVPNCYAAPLQDVGFFEDEDDAESVADAALACLRFEKWDYPLFDTLPPDGQDELRFLRRGLMAFDHIDLSLATVEVREFRATRLGDNRDSVIAPDHLTRLYPWLDAEELDEDEVLEPTDLLTPETIYTYTPAELRDAVSAGE
jgi:hypothetical protein